MRAMDDDTVDRDTMVRRKRTFGVGAVTLLLLVLAGAIALDAWRGRLELPWALPASLPREPLTRALGYVVAALLCLVAAGMWLLRRSAWVATMLLVGALMVVELLRYARGSPRYLLMVLCVLIVFYLNQRDVQGLFRRRTGPAP
jgi:hypothetical protein